MEIPLIGRTDMRNRTGTPTTGQLESWRLEEPEMRRKNPAGKRLYDPNMNVV
jgi:hypothetical protein